MEAAKVKKLTERGFPAPENFIDQRVHERGDRFFVVRMTLWEARQHNRGDGTKFQLSLRQDGTYDAIAEVKS
jgi:hypothetical protein